MTRLQYRSLFEDNARWEGFAFRPGDIVISTPPKSGTTWMQMLCALLVFDSTELDRRLSEISPWLDMQTRSTDSVMAIFAAQQHRRIIKTHTPLDGLPFDERATYICVGRDPRDVALSWDHHRANQNHDALLALRADAVGLDDLADFGPPDGPSPEDPVERFWRWVDAEPVAGTARSLAGTLHHLDTFWVRRDEPNLAMFHYADMSADLTGQMGRLAGTLAIDMPAERLAQLAAAGTFTAMRSRAGQLTPNAGRGVWMDESEFFHRGSVGHWRELIGEEIDRYETRVAQLAPADLVAWAHSGVTGNRQPGT